jgi:predicted metalloendopeptidase
MRRKHLRLTTPFHFVGLTLLALPVAAQQRLPGQGYELGVDTTAMDRSVRPQDDFARYVNGRWIERAVIPGDRARWGSFDELQQESETALRAILEEAAGAGAPVGSEMQKIGDLYASFMDSTRIEALGIQPLQGALAEVEALTSPAQLPELFGKIQRYGVRGPVSAGVGRDQKDSDAYIVTMGQSGLMLPDRDYYLREGDPYEGIREAYVSYLTRILTLAAQPDPQGAARRILELETRIATIQWDRVRNRDRDATYNRMAVTALPSLAPSFAWEAYLAAAGLGAANELVLRQPEYFEGLDDILSSTPVATWREYLTAGLIDAYAGDLPAAFVQARFELFGRTLSGVDEMRPRWRSGIGTVEGALGEALGKIYVERHFRPEAKARMDELVANLREAFRQGIDELEWMSPATKPEAHDKLEKFTVKIGYPDKWRDYSALEIRRDDLLGNVMRSRAFGYEDMVHRLGQPVDREEWGMTPQTVNAYYNSVNNEIVFPAAILQPPFFNVRADDAVNYGAIGAVIGHEISHGFDDQGRKSDGDGNLRDWWTEADASAFTQRAAMLTEQYGAYTPVEGLSINGSLTLGENIGDLSGLAVAYRAYLISLGGRPAPVIDGFTGDQRFFMGWTQVWRTKMRPEAVRNQLLTDPHSPGAYRAFVPLTNFDPFYQAFDVGIGDGMYRPQEERVQLW